MTVAQPVHCPSCGQVFQLKFQVDKTINWIAWPMVLKCPGCNDQIDLLFDHEGLHPKLEAATTFEPGIVVGYCGGLPTPAALYYKRENSGTGFFSVFLNICQAFGDKIVLEYNAWLKILQEGIVQWCQVLEISYRMITGGNINPSAYNKKMIAVFGDDIPQDRFKTPEDCMEHYDDLVATAYNALNFGSFREGKLWKLFNELSKEFTDLGRDLIEMPTAAVKGGCTPGLLDEVCQRINLLTKSLPKFLPACFLDFNGGSGDGLFLLSGSPDDINKMYADNYEVICKCLPVLMAIYNKAYNGDPDCFMRADGSRAPGDLKKFADLDNGNKVNQLMTLPVFQEALAEALNTKIRNGVNHRNVKYDLETQICKYHYDPSRPEVFVEHRLIDVAHGVLTQLRCLFLLYRYLSITEKCREIL